MPTTRASGLLTLLGPLSVATLVAVLCWFAPAPARVEREAARGGRVLNGRLLEADGIALELAESFAAGVPPVLVVGASYANADIDPLRLAEALGRPEGDVAVVSIPSSVGAHWYAVLAQHVWRLGVPGPEHVILIGSAQSLLQVEPATDGAWLALSELGADAVVDQKLGRSDPWLKELWVGRQRLRSWVVDRIGHLGVIGVSPGLGRRPDAILARAFADERMDPDRVLSRWGTGRIRKGWRSDDIPTVKQSFVGSIREVVVSHGARLSVVRVPVSERVPDGLGDDIPAETLAELRSLLGDDWVDLSRMVPAEWAFENLDHLTPEGAEPFSTLLGSVLRRPKGVDLFGPNPSSNGWALPPQWWSYAPQETSVWTGPSEWLAGGSAFIPVQREELSDLATRLIHPRGARCSPLRAVSPQGSVRHGLPCSLLGKHRGYTCHGRDGITWNPRGEGPWTVAVEADRACDGAAWLYPSDRMAALWSEVPEGANQLTVTVAWAEADIGAEVRLTVNDEERARFRVTVDPVNVPVAPISAHDRVVLSVVNSEGWGMLTLALLSRVDG